MSQKRGWASITQPGWPPEKVKKVCMSQIKNQLFYKQSAVKHLRFGLLYCKISSNFASTFSRAPTVIIAPAWQLLGITASSAHHMFSNPKSILIFCQHKMNSDLSFVWVNFWRNTNSQTEYSTIRKTKIGTLQEDAIAPPSNQLIFRW